MNEDKSMHGLSPAMRKARLRNMYFHMARAEELDRLFREAVVDYDSGVLTDDVFEASCLTIVGESNSGKTREIRHALARLKENTPTLECGREVRSVSVFLDGETTWKSLGIKILEHVGYNMSPRKKEHEIWSRVRQQLRAQGYWIVHIDECQHIFETLGKNETKKVINSIKALAKNPDWPVVVVLSGIPELLQKVNSEKQLMNPTSAFYLQSLDPLSESDMELVDTAFYHYAEARGVNVDGIRDDDTYRRICYAHGNQFGLIFKFMVDVFANVEDDQPEVDLSMLATRYAAKTGCVPGHNPFIREDFQLCAVDELLAGVMD